MSSQRESFLEELKANPYDEATHRAYADWLDENGMDDESLIHREWSAGAQRESEEWLKDFTRRINDAGSRYEDYQFYGNNVITYEQVLETARKTLEGDYSGFCIPFDTPEFIYEDNGEFWRHVAMVLWITIPEDKEPMTPFRCAC